MSEYMPRTAFGRRALAIDAWLTAHSFVGWVVILLVVIPVSLGFGVLLVHAKHGIDNNNVVQGCSASDSCLPYVVPDASTVDPECDPHDVSRNAEDNERLARQAEQLCELRQELDQLHREGP